MAETEKALIDAAAAIHEVNPGYASAFLDGVKTAMNAMRSADEPETKEEKDG